MSRNRFERWRWTVLRCQYLYIHKIRHTFEYRCCSYIRELTIASTAVFICQYQTLKVEAKMKLILQQQRRLSSRLCSHKQKMNRQRHIQHHWWKSRRRRRAAVLSLAIKQAKKAASAPWVLGFRCLVAVVVSDSKRGFRTLYQGSLEESVSWGEWWSPVEDGDGGADEGEASGWAAHWPLWLAERLNGRLAC